MPNLIYIWIPLICNPINNEKKFIKGFPIVSQNLFIQKKGNRFITRFPFDSIFSPIKNKKIEYFAESKVAL